MVTASVVTGAIAVGIYNGTITLNPTGASTVTVPVTFTVTPASTPPPITPPLPTTQTPPPTPSGLHISAVQ